MSANRKLIEMYLPHLLLEKQFTIKTDHAYLQNRHTQSMMQSFFIIEIYVLQFHGSRSELGESSQISAAQMTS